MKPIKKLQIGKNGLTENFTNQVKSIFKHEKMIKISLLQSSTRDKEKAKEIAESLIEDLGKNYTYKLIGFTIIVKKWRKSKK